MWIMDCSNSPGILLEFHTKTTANLAALFCEMGPLDNRSPCSGDHQVYDNGKPCNWKQFTGKKCRLKYEPDSSATNEGEVAS